MVKKNDVIDRVAWLLIEMGYYSDEDRARQEAEKVVADPSYWRNLAHIVTGKRPPPEVPILLHAPEVLLDAEAWVERISAVAYIRECARLAARREWKKNWSTGE